MSDLGQNLLKTSYNRNGPGDTVASQLILLLTLDRPYGSRDVERPYSYQTHFPTVPTDLRRSLFSDRVLHKRTTIRNLHTETLISFPLHSINLS